MFIKLVHKDFHGKSYDRLVNTDKIVAIDHLADKNGLRAVTVQGVTNAQVMYWIDSVEILKLPIVM